MSKSTFSLFLLLCFSSNIFAQMPSVGGACILECAHYWQREVDYGFGRISFVILT
jgi:hypothetical protein